MRMDAGVSAEVAASLGGAVVRAKHQSWGSKNETWIVTLDDARRLVVQIFSDRDAAVRRVDVSKQLERVGAVPVPRTVADGLDRAVPWAVSELILGRPGYEVAGPDLEGSQWTGMAASMGRLLPRLRGIDVTSVRLPLLWAKPDELVAKAGEWSAALGSHVSSGRLRERLAQVVGHAPDVLRDPPVLCHGDFGPQNVLFDGAAVTGLLDLEDVRIGPPFSMSPGGHGW